MTTPMSDNFTVLKLIAFYQRKTAGPFTQKKHYIAFSLYKKAFFLSLVILPTGLGVLKQFFHEK
jgi:hypothetical protein